MQTLLIKLVEGRMAPSRSFRVSFRVATGRRAAGYELRGTGHWPLAREKVVGIPSLPFESPKVYPLVFVGCVWYNRGLC